MNPSLVIPSLSATDWQAIAPAGIVMVAAILVLLFEAFAGDPDDHAPTFGLSLAGLAAALVATALLWGKDATAFSGTLALDGFALYVNVICLIAAALTLMMAFGYLESVHVHAAEFYPLVLFATSGMMVMGAAHDLVVLFLGLEIMSLAAYVLAGINRQDRLSLEASLKYFLLGAFATGFLLYGIAIFYGATGSTGYAAIAAHVAGANRLAVLAGVGMLLVGLGFKVSAVPFHAWAPDVYQGSPTPVTALMAVGIKAAAFAGVARFFLGPLQSIHGQWDMVVWWLAVLTMTVGNVIAVSQSNIKRMLAYSSIAHAGYLLVPIAAGGPASGGAVLFYLLGYAFMNLGAFAVVIALDARGELREEIADYAGLSARQPLLAGAMLVFVLSLTGVPPLVGFVGKFYLFSAAVDAGYVGLAVIGVLNSVVAAYYYTRIMLLMYVGEGEDVAVISSFRPALVATIAISVAGTILLGMFPSWAVEAARRSFLSIG